MKNLEAMIKKIGILGILWMLAALPLLAAERTVMLDGVAAYVDDEAITVGDVRDLLEPQVAKLRQFYKGAELSGKIHQAFQEARDILIEEKLILKSFKKNGAELADKIVDRRVNDLIHDRFNDDRSALLEALEKDRITYDEWRTQVRNRIIVASMRSREVDGKVMIPPAAIQAVYETNSVKYTLPEKVKLRLILIHGGQTAEDKAVRWKLAEDTRAKAAAGADFADLARKVSEDGKAEAGGEWDWIEPKDLQADLAAAIAKLKPGKISPALNVADEYYIVKLEERHAAALVPFMDAHAEIEKELRKNESTRVYQAWIERLKREFHVKTMEIEGL